MCVCGHNLSDHKAGEHPRTSNLEKLSARLLAIFYGQYQKPKETKDQFANELYILARQVIGHWHLPQLEDTG